MSNETGSPAPKKQLPDWLLFFGKFLKHGRIIASLVPSSVYLSRAVVSGIDFSKAECVVELGAGTGPITTELLKVTPPTCRCVIIERDPDFCRRLRERFPQADIVEADAGDLDKILQERGIQSVDHVLCGLPLPSFSAMDRDRVINSVLQRLKEGGSFRQLTHMPWVYQRLYRRYFEEVQFKFVFRNLPPAGFYICHGKRST